MEGTQKLVSQKLLSVLSQQQLTPDEIKRIQTKIGNNLLKSLEIIFSFYEDTINFNDCMVDQLIKQKENAKLKEIILLNSLTSITNSQRPMSEKLNSDQFNNQGQQIFEIVTNKIDELSNFFDSHNSQRSFQIDKAQKQFYEKQLSDDKFQITQLKQDIKKLKSDHQQHVQQLISQLNAKKQLQKKAMVSEIQSLMSNLNESQVENIKKINHQEREKTRMKQEEINTITKYISQLFKFDEIYRPDQGIEIWLKSLKEKVEKYKKQIQILTGKKNSWQGPNPLKQLLNHYSSKLTYRNHRLSGLNIK